MLEGSDPSLIYFAAAVEKSVDAGATQIPLSSSAAALYGTGIRQGHSMTLVNTGGQWQSNYNRPMIVVETVAPTADAAQADLDSLVAQVEQTALQMQQQADAQQSKLIKTEVSPAEPTVAFVPGNRKRALGALMLLGVGLGLAAAVGLDRSLARRRPTDGQTELTREAAAEDVEV